MPVEIRELVIRAVATLDREDTEDGPETERSGSQHASADGNEEIVQECVRQVLRILRKKEKDR